MLSNLCLSENGIGYWQFKINLTKKKFETNIFTTHDKINYFIMLLPISNL